MNVLPDPISFEWNKGNIDKSVTKHGISNQEAEEAFNNKPFLVSEDTKHAQVEKRYQAIGKSNQGKLFFLSFTIRGERVRIISARKANRKERKVYEKT